MNGEAASPGAGGVLPEQIARWLAASGIELLDFQRSASAAFARRESGIIHARTGAGKSLAVLLPFLAARLAGAASGMGRRALPRAIWLTPLRALAGSLEAAIRLVVSGIGIELEVGVRTGDTSAALRRRQLRELPDLLITTPESLHLLLSYPDTASRFAGLDLVVVDEWHDLLGTKRGILVELALAALDRHFPRHLRWGLSATTADPALAARTLAGAHRAASQILCPIPPSLEIETLIPQTIERFPWGGHLGFSLAPAVAERVRAVRSALLFTNTRFQAEAWNQRMRELLPELAPQLAIHHGALSETERYDVEERLRRGEIRLCVCTSSLDLGVDLPEVDLVVQVGSPRGVNRLMQRAGRSGHTPGGRSRLLQVPAHALELIDAESVTRAIRAHALDAKAPLELPFDMLLQFLTTRACGDGFTATEILEELRETHAYRTLTRAMLDTALQFLTHGGQTFGAYEEFRRLSESGGLYRMSTPQLTKRHRMSFGVIVADEAVKVRYLRGGPVGTVEESFIASLRPGESFLLGGKPLELLQVRNMTAFVRAATERPRSIPRWFGGTLPFTYSFARSLQQTLTEYSALGASHPLAPVIGPLLELQRARSGIPTGDQLVVETSRSRWGHHLFLYPLEGRAVHEGIAQIIASRIASCKPADISLAVNDYGIELLSPEELLADPSDLQALLDPRGALDALEQRIDLTELERRAFREIARIAGLTFQGYPGAKKSVRNLQASASLLFDVLRKYEPEHPLVLQARETVLDHRLELPRIAETLTRISRLPHRHFETLRFSPFAFPLVIETMRDQVSSVPFEERVRKLQLSLERDAERSSGRKVRRKANTARAAAEEAAPS